MRHTAGGGRTFSYRPADRLFGDDGFETSTTWNYKIVGRYTLPYEIGLSGSWKVQSGFNYGRTTVVQFPGDGQRTVRVEPITTNRYPSVQIMDVRVDKAFTFGRYGKFTAMLDAFNLTNSGVVTSARTTTVNYREVLEILNPRVIRFGVRYDF
jgi:hypothetical protein